eukprot:TRINITY_DN31_c0_g1_i1.p1 TRINITY_DN31_c0_g1~~TRINITY_DN31_c0_g1_i1.p1  ORF type:complete len:240 (+),score=56.71 TRINITY_DN31_c0_g1_i1:33-752(+)
MATSLLSHLHRSALKLPFQPFQIPLVVQMTTNGCSENGDDGHGHVTPPAPLVLCGPSGSGKSTLMKKLTAEFKDSFGFSVSHTTRAPRPGEQNGVDYHYVTRDTMEQLVKEGAFIEHAIFSGNMYGTSAEAVEKVAVSGKICILDIDVQGVKLIKQSDLEPNYVFIKPPSREALEKRLRARRTESEESLAKRLAAADAEMEYGETPGNFDIVIVNDDLEKAYSKLRAYMLPKIDVLINK